MAEHVDDALASINAEIAALRRQKPSRERAVELMRLNQILLDAARKVTDTNAAKRIADSSSAAQPVGAAATSLSDELITDLAKGVAARGQRR